MIMANVGNTRSRILTPLLIMCLSNCYDVHIKTRFGSYLPPVVCRRRHALFTLFVFVCMQQCLTRIGRMSGMSLSSGRWELLSLRGRPCSHPHSVEGVHVNQCFTFLCCVFWFVCLCHVSFVPNVASFSDLFVLDCYYCFL